MMKRHIAAVLLAAIFLSSFVWAMPTFAEVEEEPIPEELVIESAASKAGAIVVKALKEFQGDDNAVIGAKSFFSGAFADLKNVRSGISFSDAAKVIKDADDAKIADICIKLEDMVELLSGTGYYASLGNREENAKKYLEENPEVYAEVEAKVRAALKGTPADISDEEEK